MTTSKMLSVMMLMIMILLLFAGNAVARFLLHWIGFWCFFARLVGNVFSVSFVSFSVSFVLFSVLWESYLMSFALYAMLVLYSMSVGLTHSQLPLSKAGGLTAGYCATPTQHLHRSLITICICICVFVFVFVQRQHSIFIEASLPGIEARTKLIVFFKVKSCFFDTNRLEVPVWPLPLQHQPHCLTLKYCGPPPSGQI